MTETKTVEVTQADEGDGQNEVIEAIASIIANSPGMRSIPLAQAIYAAIPKPTTPERAKALEEAIKLALRCTPYVRLVGNDAYEVGYDCGDPWEILRRALESHPKPSTDTPWSDGPAYEYGVREDFATATPEQEALKPFATDTTPSRGEE